MNLNLKEKIELLDGQDVWHTKPIQDIPSVMMADGPHGLRKQLDMEDHLGKQGSVKATAFPTASLLACSFDRNLVGQVAKAIAKEAKANHVSMVLGPGINIKRSPLCGRNFEYFSEDPYLAGELGYAYVSHMEEEKIGTSVKHFFCNNQEKYRFFIDSIVDDRTLREIYLRAFEKVVKAKPASVMTSYNKVNGFYTSESPILKNLLRDEWNYQGLVVSDWGSISNRVDSIKAGCDLEMPSSNGYHEKQVLDQASKDQDLVKAIDQSAQRVQSFARNYQIKDEIKVDLDRHHKLAIDVASESMVLLKNEDILPLQKQEKILMITGFDQNIRYQGGGSSHINPYRLEQFYDVIKNDNYQMKIVKGFRIDQDIDDESLIDEALLEAVKVDKVVVVCGLPEYMETEGFDREHLNIPDNQINLVNRLSNIHQNIGLVVLTGSVVNLSSFSQVKGLLLSYLGGQGSAQAILDILYGKKNPSGRLAETWIDDVKDCNVQLTTDNQSVYYDESIYVGYRYYDTFNKRVRYPFGYGLSYSKFTYHSFEIEQKEDKYLAKISLSNDSEYIGKEVIQVYVKNPRTSLHKAKRQLIAFNKVELKPHETKEITLTIDPKEFRVYDVENKAFVHEKGKYVFELSHHVGSVILSEEVDIEGKLLEAKNLSYLKDEYDPSDFDKLYGKPLPKRNVVRKRPYSLDSTLEDCRNTIIGKLIANQIQKAGIKAMGTMETPWLMEVAKKTLNETPLKMLGLFSDGTVSLEMIEGLVDIMNLRLIKGYKKIRKDKKEKSKA